MHKPFQLQGPLSTVTNCPGDRGVSSRGASRPSKAQQLQFMSKQVAPELPLCCFGHTGPTEHWATNSPNDQRVQTARTLPSLGKMVIFFFFFNGAEFCNSPTLKPGSSPAARRCPSPIRNVHAIPWEPCDRWYSDKVSLKQACLFSFTALFHLLINSLHTYLVPSNLMLHYKWN